MLPVRLAFITPSYAADHQRCLLLCESLDRMATSDFMHYILVADHDRALFAPLEGLRRHVIPDSILLPTWLKPIVRPFGGGRRIWWSAMPPVWPMSGWHVQQLRKMLIARHINEDVMVMADSDSVFVRPFGRDAFVRDGLVRFYAQQHEITYDPAYQDHRTWVSQAASILGLQAPCLPATDYINNLVSWRRDHALKMLAHIEQLSSRNLSATLGRSRTFSEYQIYGAYVNGVAGGSGHFADPEPLSLTYWNGDALTEASLRTFVDKLSPRQIAICVQSFTGTSTDLLRAYLAGRASAQ
jgi:Family of unknown function (DUF6492)